MAWKNRDGGDKSHSNGRHYAKDARGRALQAFAQTVTSSLVEIIRRQPRLGDQQAPSAAAVHDEALALLNELHGLPVHESGERARRYGELITSRTWRHLKRSMDLWCACWFWPADRLEAAPLPTSFAAPSEATSALVAEIAASRRFFHWELEFPDVFQLGRDGFDAILGNPPWETLQPNSKEYFSNIDPLYRTYGKQEALRYQSSYFENSQTEQDWLDYCAGFADDSNWMKSADNPFGDPARSAKPQERVGLARGKGNDEMHAAWRSRRSRDSGFADPRHPFRHRGEGKAYTYKLFTEQAHALLREGGRLGFIVPSGLYSDAGTGALRELLLEHCSWEWLFGFENRDKIFDIHRSFKFNPVIIQKGGRTSAIRAAFMRRRLEDWERAEEIVTDYAIEQVERFSPRSRAILEIQSARDLEILEKIYANSVLLGDEGPDGWGVRYSQGDFNMTSDSKLFPPRPQWEAKGYRPDEYSRWILGDWRPIGELWAELGVKPLAEGERRCAQPPYDRLPIPRADIQEGVVLSREVDAFVWEGAVRDVALPLYQGVMFHQFDHSQKGWVSGTGLQAQWDNIRWERKIISPQFLMSASSAPARRYRTLHRRVARNTDTRMMIATLDCGHPAGDKSPVLSTDSVRQDLWLLAVLNSFVFDNMLRNRCGATNLDLGSLEATPLPHRMVSNSVLQIVIRVVLGFPEFSDCAVLVGRACGDPDAGAPRKPMWAFRDAERLRCRAILDAVVAAYYGLSFQDLHHMLRECDHPRDRVANQRFARGLDPKGFWRVDKDKDPELRHTVLTLVAFSDLQQKMATCGGVRDEGIEAFLSQGDGEGWSLPQSLRLADYGLGHDDRSTRHELVAARCGVRFHEWQTFGDANELWRELHLHARNLLGKIEYGRLLPSAAAGMARTSETSANESEAQGLGHRPQILPEQRELF